MAEPSDQNVEGQNASENKPVVKVDDLKAQLESQAKTSERLLDESRAWKVRAQKAEELNAEQKQRETSLQQEKAEAEGNWKSLYETEKAKSDGLETDLNDFQKFVSKREIDAALRLAAIKLQAHDPSDVLHVIDYSRVSADDKGNVLNADQLIAEIKGNKPYMFAGRSLPQHIESGHPASKAPAAVELDSSAISKLVRSDDKAEREKGYAAMRVMQAAERRV